MWQFSFLKFICKYEIVFKIINIWFNEQIGIRSRYEIYISDPRHIGFKLLFSQC